MMKCNTTYYGSLTRISDLEARPYNIEKVPRLSWATGDYIIGRYVEEGPYNLELSDGSLQPLKLNDMVIGALGDRQATKEVVGSWQLIGDGSSNVISMQMICGSGIFGIETSRCSKHPPSPNFIYEGHCLRFGSKLSMKDFGSEVTGEMPHCKMILIVGSSMSCGKTLTGQALINIIKRDLGFDRVAAAKFTGVGYNNDIKQFSEAGADFVCDFVDCGYPSTVMPPEEYRLNALPAILALLSEQNPDCIVAEVGASPFEQYNGVEVLKHLLSNAYSAQVYLMICASDVYAVLGLRQALVEEGLAKGIIGVSGMATCNSAGAALVKRMSGLQAFNLNVNEPSSVADIRMILEKCLLD